MPRYFFHVVCGSNTSKDADGQISSSLRGAKAQAHKIARGLAQDESFVGCSICIADEQGNDLDRVEITNSVISTD